MTLPAWMAEAACRRADPAAFFPERGRDPAPALRVCDRCPVREPCLDYAVATSATWGVWGGTTASQRRNEGEQPNLSSSTSASR